jgi:transcriptional regulator of arginine metabolism
MKNLDQLILEIIQNNKITKQIELIEILRKNGIEINQPNLSRKMDKLSIKKDAGIYAKQAAPMIKHHHVKSIAKSMPNLIVIHTSSGFAGSVAAEIDQCRANQNRKFKAILGTIAGDDTVLVVVGDPKDLQQAYIQLEDYFSEI